MLTYGAGLTFILIALSEGHNWGWTSGKTLGLLAAAFFLWAAFVFIEKKVNNPLFQLGLFAYRDYSIGLGITMSYCIGYFAVTVLLTLYLQGALNLSPLESGLLLIPLSVPQLFTAPFGGRLADRVGTAKMIVLGSMLIGFSLFMLGQLGSELSNMAVIVPLLIISAATGLSWPSLAKAVLSAAPQEQAGSASGMFWTVYNMCRAISQALAFAVVQAVGKSDLLSPLLSGVEGTAWNQSKEELVRASNIGFQFFAVFLALAVVLGLFLLRPQHKNAREKAVTK